MGKEGGNRENKKSDLFQAVATKMIKTAEFSHTNLLQRLHRERTFGMLSTFAHLGVMNCQVVLLTKY